MSTKKNLKNDNGKDELKMTLQDSGKISVKLKIGLNVDGRTSKKEKNMN